MTQFTAQSWSDAASQRLQDAAVLALAERYTGAAYLLGYVAEMELKAAVQYVAGLHAATWEHLRQRLEQQRHRGFIDRDAEGWHGLGLLADVLVAMVRKRGWYQKVRAELKAVAFHAKRVSMVWSVDLRYSGVEFDRQEWIRLAQDVQALSEKLQSLRS